MEFCLQEDFKNSPFIVLISGKMRNGKDTMASFLKEKLEQSNKKVLITHYADYLKYICKEYYEWDGNKDEKGRKLLQKVGNDFRQVDRDIWVKPVIDLISTVGRNYDFVLIPDVRYINEVSIIKELFNSLSIRIDRPSENEIINEQKRHISETNLDNYRFDVYVENTGTLEDLKNKSDVVLREIMIKKEEIKRII